MMNSITANDVLAKKMSDSIFLNKEEYKALQQEVMETPIGANNLIDAFPLESVSPMRRFYQYTKLDKYGSATESSYPGDADAVEVNGTQVSVQIPFYEQDVKYSMFDLEEARSLGEPLDVVKTRAAVEGVNTLLDEALWSRSSKFGTLGAYGLFTGTASAASNWTGTDASNIFNDIVSWLGTIPQAYQSQENVLILHRDQYFELFNVNSYGLSAGKLIREAFPGLRIIESKQVTAGTGLIFPFRKDVVHLVSAWPLSAIEWDSKPMAGHFKVLRSARLVVVAPTAGLKLSGL